MLFGSFMFALSTQSKRDFCGIQTSDITLYFCKLSVFVLARLGVFGPNGGHAASVAGFQPIRAALPSGLGSLWVPSVLILQPVRGLGFAGNQPPRMLSLYSVSLSLEEVTEVVRWCSCIETMCFTFCLFFFFFFF